MAIKRNFINVLTLVVAMFAMSVFVVAQETVKTDDNVMTKKESRQFKRGVRDGFRGGKRDGMKGGRHRGMKHMFRGLNLTDEQKAQMKSIREANKPDQATREEMKSIMTAKRGGTITAEQTERLKQFKAQRREKSEAVRQQMLNVLTAEQRTQLEQKKLEMRQKFEERRQMREQRMKKPAPTEEKKDN